MGYYMHGGFPRVDPPRQWHGWITPGSCQQTILMGVQNKNYKHEQGN